MQLAEATQETVTKSVVPIPSEAELTQMLQTLNANKKAWAEMPVSRKIKYLDDIEAQMAKVDIDEYVRGNTEITGFLDPADKSPMAKTARVAEAILATTVTLNVVRKIRRTLQEMEASGGALRPIPVRKTEDGCAVASVYPWTTADKVFGFGSLGATGELWLEDRTATVAERKWPTPPAGGRVSLVLGAGNQVMSPFPHYTAPPPSVLGRLGALQAPTLQRAAGPPHRALPAGARRRSSSSSTSSTGSSSTATS